MAGIKTRAGKRIAKQMGKLLKQHGEEVVTGLLRAAVSATVAPSAD
jgi:hypothetical protein